MLKQKSNCRTKLYRFIVITQIVAMVVIVFAGCLSKRQRFETERFDDASPLNMKYEEPQEAMLSDFERSITLVSFNNIFGKNDLMILKSEIYNTLDAFYTYRGVGFYTDIDLMEWNNIVRVLSNGIKNTRVQTSIDTTQWLGSVYINCGQCPENKDGLREDGFDAYSPTWDDFSKLMNDIETRIRLENGVDMLENEYERKFASPMSDIEFSTLSLKYQDPMSYFSIRKTATGAIVTDDILCQNCLPGDARYDCDDQCYRLVKFDNEEWLDFVRALHQTKIADWRETYNADTTKMNKWWLGVKFSALGAKDWYMGSDSTYPEGWDGFEELMNDMATKIKGKIDEAEVKLREGYAKRNMGTFEQMFEQTAKTVSLRNIYIPPRINDVVSFQATKTAGGAVAVVQYGTAIYLGSRYVNYIDVDEWLDFVNALHKHNAVVEPKKYERIEAKDWFISITNRGNRIISSYGNKKHPLDWDGLNKFLIKIETRVKKGRWR